VDYSRAAFEADLPRIESTCNRTTGAGCTLIPITDKGTPAAFYPFFSALQRGDQSSSCLWAFGNDLPGASSDFGRNAQYASLLPPPHLASGGGGPTVAPSTTPPQPFPTPCLPQRHKGRRQHGPEGPPAAPPPTPRMRRPASSPSEPRSTAAIRALTNSGRK